MAWRGHFRNTVVSASAEACEALLTPVPCEGKHPEIRCLPSLCEAQDLILTLTMGGKERE